MATFIVQELQRVLVVREVEADNEDSAYEAFCEGEGVPYGRDGEVTGADLISVTEG